MKFSAKILLPLVILGAVCAFIAWQMGWIDRALGLKEPVLAWCRSHPVALFAAIAILPGIGFPVSALLVLAGVVWGSTPLACGLALIAVLMNITWSHLLASGIGGKWLRLLLGKHWERWSSTAGTGDWRLACILRITPGIPLFVQNYLMGLLGIPLRHSLAIAIPTTGLYVCGFVLTGGAIFEGRIGLLIVGVSVLVAASLAVKMIRRRMALTSGSVRE